MCIKFIDIIMELYGASIKFLVCDYYNQTKDPLIIMWDGKHIYM